MSDWPDTTDAPTDTSPRPSRSYVFPEPGDTLGDLAARLLPDQPDGVQLLMSWNLHLIMRPFPVGEAGEVLCTDIVYLEPPLA
jgi:hypothetical protein